MYAVNELVMKKSVTYTEMMLIAQAYAKNLLGVENTEAVVLWEYARICAVLHAFCEVGDVAPNVDELMHSVFSYGGYARYMNYICEHTPMGRDYFAAFVGMLDRADAMADKKQPVDVLLDSLTETVNNLNELIKPNTEGVSVLDRILEAVKTLPEKVGEAAPVK